MSGAAVVAQLLASRTSLDVEWRAPLVHGHQVDVFVDAGGLLAASDRDAYLRWCSSQVSDGGHVFHVLPDAAGVVTEQRVRPVFSELKRWFGSAADLGCVPALTGSPDLMAHVWIASYLAGSAAGLGDRVERRRLVIRPTPTLSVCLVVRDVAETLALSLRSVADVADEIRIVDKGSNDGTAQVVQEMAGQLEVPIFYRGWTWEDDDAAIRNAVLADLETDWILHLDGDEVLMGRRQLRRLMHSEFIQAYDIVIDEPGPAGSRSRCETRLFQRSGVRFLGAARAVPRGLSGERIEPCTTAHLLSIVSLRHVIKDEMPPRVEDMSRRTGEDARSCTLASSAPRLEGQTAAAGDAVLTSSPGTKLKRKQTWIVIAAGQGRGETAIIRPLVQAAVRRGHRVQVLTDCEGNRSLLRGPWDVTVSPNLSELSRFLTAGADRLVLSSSALFTKWLSALPEMVPDLVVASVEFTWPTWLSGNPGADGIHSFIACLPQEAWDAGLGSRDPRAALPPSILERTTCVGFLPEPRSRSVRDRALPPRVFLYFGTRPGWIESIAGVLATSLQRLRDARGIEATYVCGAQALPLPSWVDVVDSLDFPAFQEAVFQADLVVSHGGAGTAFAAISAGTPNLCLTSGNCYRGEGSLHADLLAHVLFRCGRVEHLAGTFGVNEYAGLMGALLDDGPWQPEGGGADRAVRVIETLPSVPQAAKKPNIEDDARG